MSAPSLNCPGEGYKFLSKGDLIQQGDEWVWSGGMITPCIYSIGLPLADGVACRRKLTKKELQSEVNLAQKTAQ